MQAALARLVDGRDLSADQAIEAMELIASGQASEAQIAALITGLRIKGESVDEIASFAIIYLLRALENRKRG